MFKRILNSKLFINFVAIAVLTASAIFLSSHNENIGVNDNLLGGTFPDAQWYNFTEFTGYQTDVDPEKVGDGSNPQGQNTSAFETDRFGVRDYGFENFPSTAEASTTLGKISSIHNFRKRNGENILMRSYSTVLEYFDESQDKWVNLKSGLTADQKFGFADYNINTDLTSYTYFGNAVDPFMRWTGSITHLTENVPVGTTTIKIIDAYTDFTATSSVKICGNDATFTARATTTDPNVDIVTLATSTTFSCTVGQEVFESVQEYTTRPRGNIYIVFDNRLFIAGIVGGEQTVWFSKYGDPLTWANTLISASTLINPGIFNLGEGGGAVAGMTMDEESLYILKRSIIYKVGITDQAYSILPLKTFDGKSQTVGATHSNSVFAGGNGIFFITPDNQILFLERVAQIDYPQLTPISNIIKNTILESNFDESSGIVFRDKAYFSFKSSNNVSTNDTVLVYNIKEKTWDSPVVGWNVQDWAVYNDGTGEKLYFSSAISYNISKVTGTPLDGIFDVKANWRSKKYSFGATSELKEIKGLFIEGYISENTDLKISAILDDGAQVISTDLKGTETTYLYDTSSYNVFGFSSFGTERFGSNENISGKKRFRVYLTQFRANPFYSIQLEFASEGENQAWEILGYSLQVQKSPNNENRKLYKSFN